MYVCVSITKVYTFSVYTSHVFFLVEQKSKYMYMYMYNCHLFTPAVRSQKNACLASDVKMK